MENKIDQQPLDSLMDRLGISNADLVKASTEQLSFKMVSKSRSGRRLSSNIQEKILNALLTVKPELKLRRRDLFRYPADPAVAGEIAKALTLARNKKISYPQFVDRLDKAGVLSYTAEPAANRVTFYISGGEAHVEQGPVISESAPGRFDPDRVRSAIADAQKGLIDHPAFLRRIHDAGILVYEANIRHRRIAYKGDGGSYKENIPLSSEIAGQTPSGAEASEAPTKKKPAKKKKSKNKRKSMTTKARVSFRKRNPKRRKRRGNSTRR